VIDGLRSTRRSTTDAAAVVIGVGLPCCTS
jgi:hypothetical protein